MNINAALTLLVSGQHLEHDEMRDVMLQVMTGGATDAQIGGLLLALRMAGETVDEIAGAASVMRDLSTKVNVNSDNLVDTCGTGGSGIPLFNISTAAAFVVAAAGGSVAKHGNRAMTGKSGSADVLEAAGVRIDLSPEQVALCVQEVGLGFMFAPAHHSATKHAMGPRKEIGVRSIFNILGPLTNPAGAKSQLLGVSEAKFVLPMAQVLRNLGSKHVLVVHGAEGLDEISLSAVTQVAELKNGDISQWQITPSDYGFNYANNDDIKVSDAKQSLALVKQALGNQSGPALDIVVLNAAGALYAADLADSYEQGLELAQDLIGSGQAKEKLTHLVQFSQHLGNAS